MERKDILKSNNIDKKKLLLQDRTKYLSEMKFFAEIYEEQTEENKNTIENIIKILGRISIIIKKNIEEENYPIDIEYWSEEEIKIIDGCKELDIKFSKELLKSFKVINQSNKEWGIKNDLRLKELKIWYNRVKNIKETREPDW